MKKGRWVLVGLTALLAAWSLTPAQAQRKAPAGAGGTAKNVLEDGYIFNIVEWNGGELPRMYERSDQLPMTLEDLRKLSASGFSPQAIIKMLEERRCACDASVDAMIELKRAGVSEEVIQAVSLHALPPNRSLALTIAMNFEGLGGDATVSTQSRKGYLYLIIPDGGRERVFMGEMQAILGGVGTRTPSWTPPIPFSPRRCAASSSRPGCRSRSTAQRRPWSSPRPSPTYTRPRTSRSRTGPACRPTPSTTL